MNAAAYISGLCVIALATALLAWGGRRARTALVPEWQGPIAWLADAVVSLWLLAVVVQLLGAVGLFRRVPVLLGCAVAASVVAAVAGRLGPMSVDVDADAGVREEEQPAHRRWLDAAALVSVSVVAVQWMSRVVQAYRQGIGDYDSLWYHLPFAARFAQQGWLTRLPYVSPDFPTNFHPANAEALHAFGMVMMGRDLLSPLVNVGWAALALLAGWSAGRPWRAERLTLVATAVVLAVPEMAATQAGTAKNDVVTVALVAATAAFLLQGRTRGPLVLAAMAAGMALGTKLTLLAPLGVLSIAVVLMAGRGRRWATLATWSVPMAATGAFWYVRNLVRTGNPVGLDIGLGPVSLRAPSFAVVEERGFSIAHYVTDTSVWREWFAPGLHSAFGPGWPLLLLVPGAGLVAALVTRQRSPVERVLALTAAVGILAYLVMPTSAVGPEGRPVLFYLTVRYVAPFVWLGLVLAVGVWHQRAPVLLVVFGALFASGVLARGPLGAWPRGDRPAVLAALVATAALLTFVMALRWSVGRGLALPALLVAGAMGGMGLLYVVQVRHYRDRYDAAVFAWVRSVEHRRIGFAGFEPHYPYFGDDLSNTVTFLGRRTARGGFEQIDQCEEWRRAIGAADLDYLIVLPTVSFAEPSVSRSQVDWARADEGLEPVLSLQSPPATFYRVDPAYRPASCRTRGSGTTAGDRPTRLTPAPS